MIKIIKEYNLIGSVNFLNKFLGVIIHKEEDNINIIPIIKLLPGPNKVNIFDINNIIPIPS